MTAKDYISLARIVGSSLREAYMYGGEECRTYMYDVLYRPLVDYLKEDNPRFNFLLFAAAVSKEENREATTK